MFRNSMVRATCSKRLVTSSLLARRNFGSSLLRFNEEKAKLNTDQTPSQSQSTAPKRKPLSRIPIGGTQTKSQKNVGSGSVEFATWKAGLLMAVTGGVIYYFFTKEKRKLKVQQEAEANRGYGKPLVGGPFELIDHNGNKFTNENLKGQFNILYFGFTHCPDICPDELDKLGIWLNKLKSQNINVQPIFITCDPNRDTPKVVKEYLEDFHPDIIGLTGTYEQVKNICKQYRVYFSTPPTLKPGQDYLVDHSIFFYLMDSDGEFVDAMGRNYDQETGPLKIKEQYDAFIPKAEREKKKEGGFLSSIFG
ncbi:hypothetical protein BN7_3136 [Wickerhamomyces ciferrii]|uniref:Thioredoxin domain-containing protein n=1 Tax=Wickerhamomyces ciferrii (strain ATCC 14091 / BCRC 22168 / CBS 111 / JCM 3599 / NBRC 0793 / NRRL Y-1031 F-60-10) TaxID=1206466 RepID=K0KQP1_WICCF|nr:uncharacterized protein BN7_3136 [Wickerhamomyces ciferrii]CCH43583.1 hypothetical protein BN7_3136 [Wickerhamomyces ciferrii]